MSDAGERSFWLCHSCGAQMRPIRVDGVPHCASCNSEFIEILDSSINPDPFHDLPPSPPTRPMSSPPIPSNRPTSPYASPGSPSIFSSLFSNIFGGGQDSGTNDHPHANQRDTPATAPGSPGGRGGGGGGRTYTFNIGGGTGSVTFGTFGGGAGGSGSARGHAHMHGGFNPFGPSGGDQGGGLDAFFPGFPPPPNPHGQGQGQGQRPRGPWPPGPSGQPGDPNDLFRALMSLLADEGVMQGPQGRMDMGDYVASQNGFDAVMERLMQAAGPQGPLPATDAVIEGLPRFKLDEQKIEKSPFKDCPVCKDDFVPDDEVMRVPCEHIFHVDCLQPWLKTNGSCPVCRFSLVPDDSNRQPRAPQPPTASGDATTGTGTETATSPFTNVLNRLWGQSGSSSGVTATSPTEPTSASTSAPQHRVYSPPTSPPPQTNRVYDPPSDPPPHLQSSGQPQQQQQPMNLDSEADPAETFPNAIPDDYRARHRQREREQQQRDRNPYVDDLD